MRDARYQGAIDKDERWIHQHSSLQGFYEEACH